MILNITASSALFPPASNLQCEIVLLSSDKAGRRPGELSEIRPQAKKEWIEDSAADVIGAVDKGDLIRFKNGESIVGSGISSKSNYILNQQTP